MTLTHRYFSLSALALFSVLLVGCGGTPSPPPQKSSATTPSADTDIPSLRKQADAGNAEAQFKLGAMYGLGPKGLLQDYELAASWCRKAADQGYAPAQSSLGVMYLSGRGVPQDDAQAAAWFRKAADQRYAPAQCNLGVMHFSGRGVPQDDTQAVVWFQRAADQGNGQALNELGMMYQKGRGVRQDDAEALKSFLLASRFGFPPSANPYVNERETVVKSMTRPQRADVERLAREWLAAFEKRTK